MVLLVKLLGIVIVVFCAVFISKPEAIKKYFDFWMKGSRFKVGAIISAAIGILLLRASRLCSIGWIVAVIGIISIAKGVMLWSLGPQKMQKKVGAIMKLPAQKQRLLMLISLAIGILLIYSA